jgi:general secretion pathway protein G
MNRMKRRGFTLVELMLVVVIIGVLAGVVLPRLVGSTELAKINATKSQLSILETTLYNYQLQVGKFPTTDEGLKALVEDPGEEGWRGPYLKQRKIPKDAWGNPFVYVKEAKRGIDYDLYSWGPDEIEGTEDDIYTVEDDEE